MHTLAGLSDDVLDSILASSSLSVATLWCAGDRSFNKRIARCCRSVRTDASLRTFTVKKWPRMLSELLSLEVLSLDVHRFDEGLEVLKAEVQRLSPTIIELELRFLFATVLWLDEMHLVQVTSIPVPLRYPLQVLPQGRIFNSVCWDMKLHFPKLTKAAFTEKHDGRSLLRWHYGQRSLAIFPPTLTHLEWHILLDHYVNFEKLPMGLTWLDFGSRSSAWDPPTELNLPPFLTHLNGIPMNGLTQLALLPRSLTTGQWLTNETFVLRPKGFQSLPPLTKSFMAGRCTLQVDLSVTWTSLLPRQLMELEWYSTALQVSEITQLPRTITSLLNIKLSFNDLLEGMQRLGLDGLHKAWPPALRSISFASANDGLDPFKMDIFPPTLTSIRNLKITSVHDLLMNSSALLPPHLECLEVVFADHRRLDSSNSREPLPKSLRELSLTRVEIGIATIGKLPRGLRILRLPSTTISKNNYAGFAKALPPNLEILELWKIYDKAIYELPTSVTSLTVFQHSDPAVNTLECADTLPSGLTSIAITGLRKTIFSNNPGAIPKR